jgi:hypothetical protein
MPSRGLRAAVLAFLSLATGAAGALAAPPSLDVRGLAFTPVDPCRILDTRPLSQQPGAGEGPLQSGVPYSFDVAEDDAVACGIPSPEAKAVLLNFVAVGATGNGNLRVWPWDNSNPAQPSTSILNFTSGFNTVNGVVVAICNITTASQGCGEDLFAQANGASIHLVVDVLGYFSSPGGGPLWGRGRPGTFRTGVQSGDFTIPCQQGIYRFGLSAVAVSWAEAAEACPANTWVCTAAQRGTGECNTARLDDESCDFRDCDGVCGGLAPDGHLGWLADQGDSPNITYGMYRAETAGAALGYPACATLPVWCCSL